MYAFNGCKKLYAIELNDGIEILGDLCFALTNLTKIEIPSSVKEINYPFTVNDDNHSRLLRGWYCYVQNNGRNKKRCYKRKDN